MINFKTIKPQLPLILSGLIILVHYITIYELAVNIPRFDDFRNILSFLNQFEGDLSLFFKPSEEHRNVITRLIALVDLKLNGSINFTHLIIIGQLFILGFHLVVYKTVISKINAWLFVPFVLFNYQISSFDTVLWGLVSIQHYGTLFFAMLSFYFLTSKTSNMYIALLFAILSTFTFGNGFLVFLIGTFILLKTKNYNQLIIWIIIGLTVTILFFYNHNSPKIKYITYYNPLDIAPYFLSLIGNFIGFENYFLAIFIGCILVVLFIWLLFKKQFWDDKMLSAMLLFCIITLIAIALNRFYISPKHAFANHYKTYPMMFIGLIGLAYSKYYASIYIRNGVMLSALFVYVYCQINYFPKAKASKNKLEYALIYHQQNKAILIDNAPLEAELTLKKSIEKGIYKIPEKYLKK